MHASSQQKFCLCCFLNRFGVKKEMEVVLIKIKAIILSISRWIESEGSNLS